MLKGERNEWERSERVIKSLFASKWGYSERESLPINDMVYYNINCTNKIFLFMYESIFIIKKSLMREKQKSN